MVLGLGGPELLIIVAVALVLFGPKNLPKLGSAVGKTVKNFRDGMEAEEDDEPVSAPANPTDPSTDPDDADAE